jgi:hypothetical protein
LRPVDGNDAGGDLMQLANWKDKLPHGHRQKAMDLLLDVTASEAVAGDEYFDPDCQEVRLDAFWGIDVDAKNAAHQPAVPRPGAPLPSAVGRAVAQVQPRRGRVALWSAVRAATRPSTPASTA